MANPLMGRGADFEQSFAGMEVGEIRTVHLPTKSKEEWRIVPDMSSLRAKTITRTDRPFIYDWVDSTNEELRAKGRDDIFWIVDKNLDTQLVQRSRPRRPAPEWKPREGETAEIIHQAAEAVRAKP